MMKNKVKVVLELDADIVKRIEESAEDGEKGLKYVLEKDIQAENGDYFIEVMGYENW